MSSKSDVPWHKNSFVYCVLAFLTAFMAAGGEAMMRLAGHPEGLPEVVTTSLFSLASVFGTLAMQSVEARTKSGDDS